jgi:hypothetical protein
MIHLKDDILKDLKNFERNYSDKFKSLNKIIDEKLEEFEKRIEVYNQRLFKISQMVVDDRSIKEKIDNISQDKTEIKDQILKIGVKLDKLEKQYDEKIDGIENILNDSVIYSGIIGNKGRFINFHEFIDYMLSQIAKLTITAQKHTSEINSYKGKLESNIQKIKLQNEGILKTANQFSKKLVSESENGIKDIIKLYESDFKKMKEENDKCMNKLEEFNNEIRNKLKSEIETEKIKFEEENNKVEKLVSSFEKQINDLKGSYDKINEELKVINEKISINEEIRKMEENRKELQNKNEENKQIDENEIINKYLKGEISENQFIIYKELMKLSYLIKNIIKDILEKRNNENIKNKHSKKNRNSIVNNLASYLNSCFNNIISEISNERTKRKTVSNLLHCVNLKLSDKKKDEQEQHNSMLNIRKNLSDINFKTLDINNELKIKTSENNNFMKNDLGYKTFQMNNRKYNFRLINPEDTKKISEASKQNERNIIKEEEEINIKNKDLGYVSNKNDNIIIEYEKRRNEELRVKEYNNKMPPILKEKNIINKNTNIIKKELFKNILKNNIDNENISRRRTLKENIIHKINNNIKREEESKQSRILSNTLSQRREIENLMDQNTISVITYKPFKGKKYFSYEKSFDAKIKEKLICNDIDYKDKIKKIRETRFNNNDISFVPNENIKIPKTKKSLEIDNIKKLVNNLQSYIGENSLNNKYYIPRNNRFNISSSTTKIKDNIFNKELFS